MPTISELITENYKTIAPYESIHMGEFLNIMNSSKDTEELVHNIADSMYKLTGCDAIGLRIQRRGDFPYFETRGFNASFVEAESNLCVIDSCGERVKDKNGESILECMCGNILSNRINLTKPFYTPYGSFWTGSTSKITSSEVHVDVKGSFRNRCKEEGFESVALIPLKTKDKTIGLMQFNYRRVNALDLKTMQIYEEFAQYISCAVQKKLTEDLLLLQKARYLSIFEAIPYLVFTIDLSFKILDCNSRIEAILGYEKREILGKDITDFFDHPYRDEIKKVIDSVAKTAIISDEEYKMIKKDWVLIDARCIVSPMKKDKADGEDQILILVEDLTALHLINDKNEEAKKQIFLSSRMASIGLLAAGAAHEINNPLAIIVGYIDDLEDINTQKACDDNISHILKKMSKAAMRIKDIIRGLSLHSKADIAQITQIDIEGAILDTLSLLTPIYSKKGIRFNINFTSQDHTILGNKNEFYEVIMSLCTNSKNNLEDKNGGDITIRTESGIDTVTIYFRDNGRGISDEEIDKVFDPFFTARNGSEKAGMGYYIVYSLIRKLGGMIKCDSTPDQGTTMTITLPLFKETDFT